MALEQSTPQNRTQSGTRRREFAWWRLHIKKGMKDASDEQLAEGVESCEAFEVAFAAVVVIGVIFEFFVGFSHPPYDSLRGIWWPIIGEALVAIGLVVEVLASLRGKTLQSELTQRSNKRLEEAEGHLEETRAEAAEAYDRAAQAEKQTQELSLAAEKERHARLKLERETAPRRLTSEQKGIIISEVAKAPRDLWINWPPDGEAETLGREIFGCLHLAGCRVFKPQPLEHWYPLPVGIEVVPFDSIFATAFEKAGLQCCTLPGRGPAYPLGATAADKALLPPHSPVVTVGIRPPPDWGPDLK